MIAIDAHCPETSLRIEAALALCPGNLSKGLDELDVLVAEKARQVRPLKRMTELALLLSATAGFAFGCVLYLTDGEAHPASRPWLQYLAALLVIGGGIISWQKLQHNELGKRMLGAAQPIPAALQSLIIEFASGDRYARTKQGTVPRELFRSHWAVLLFSADSEVRGWVRSATGQRETKEIYTVCRNEMIVVEPISGQGVPTQNEAGASSTPPIKKRSGEWANTGWPSEPSAGALIAKILAGVEHGRFARYENVLNFMANFCAARSGAVNLRARCIEATSKAFDLRSGYGQPTLAKIYDGTYKPMGAILLRSDA